MPVAEEPSLVPGDVIGGAFGLIACIDGHASREQGDRLSQAAIIEERRQVELSGGHVCKPRAGAVRVEVATFRGEGGTERYTITARRAFADDAPSLASRLSAGTGRG